MSAELTGLGLVVVDHLAVLPEFPARDTKTIILEDRIQIGAPVPTALALLSRFGHRCAFLGSWGDDEWGRMIEVDFAELGIDYGGSVVRAGVRTGYAQAWIDAQTGERTLASYRPQQPLTPGELDRDRLRNSAGLHLDGWPEDAAIEAAEIVKRNGGKVFLDTGSYKPRMEALIPWVDCLNAPLKFLRQFLQTDDWIEGSRRLQRMGPGWVTVTDGPRGAVLCDGDQCLHEAAVKIDAIDTCGAGDVFAGAMVHCAMQDFAADEALRFACHTAALKCQGLGNRDSLPSVADVMRSCTSIS